MRRLTRVMVAAGLMVAPVVLVTSVVLITPPAQAAVTCEKFGLLSIQNGRYNVQNNVWGANTTQCINTTDTGFTVTQANHNNPTNGAPAAYPSAYFGCHYANCTSGSGLPVQASTSMFAGLRSSVSYTYPSSGTWNASYDLWFDPTPRTDGQNTGAEVMIWLNRQGPVQPVGSQVGTVNLAGGTWAVWFGYIGWNVISYVRTSAANSLSFTVNDFYSDAISRGYAQRGWYLTSIQAGFEPWVGGTGLTLNSFSVTSGGGTTPPTTTTTTGSPPPGSCRVSYAPNTWPGGFTAEVAITNTSSATVNGWTLTFSFPGNQRITGRWNADITQNGNAVTARDVGYNRTIAPGGRVTFGFQGTYTTSNPSPTSFALNGAACAVG